MEFAIKWIRDGGFVVVCTSDKEIVRKVLIDTYGEGCCCTDDELINALNYSVATASKGKRLFVWGTGYWSDRINYMPEAYIDNDSSKWGN